MITKSIKNIFAAGLVCCCLAASMTALTGCNSYIEEDTDGLSTTEQVGDSKEACDLWVTGVYSKWLYDIFCWGYFPRVLEIDADYITGPNWLYAAFGSGMFQGNGADIADALWKGGYGLIERANTAITHIEAMQNVEASYKNNALGELKFQKAFAYFLLVRAYGAIPLLNADVDQTNNPRVSVEKVYQEIFTLLEDAVSLMYKNTDAAYSVGHVCKGTAAGLLAKAYATAAASAMGGDKLYIRTGQPYTTDANGDKQYAAPVSQEFTMQTVTGYETCMPVHQDVRLRRGKVHYALMPVWLLSTQWKDKNFLFAMNGQTGKLVGDLYLDRGRWWAMFGAIAAPLAAVMALLLYVIL